MQPGIPTYAVAVTGVEVVPSSALGLSPDDTAASRPRSGTGVGRRAQDGSMSGILAGTAYCPLPA